MGSGLRTIGILGAGKVGTVLARIAIASGYRVLIAASGDPARIALIVDVLAPGAEATTGADVIERSDLVILALPLGRALHLPPEPFTGKLVIDGTNYWEPNDGLLPEVRDDPRSTSEILQEHLPGTRLIKAFGHLGYHDLDERHRPAGDPKRVALAVAGDDPDDVATVAALVDSLGFDPVVAGPLARGAAFQAHTPVFGVPMSRQDLVTALGLGPAPSP